MAQMFQGGGIAYDAGQSVRDLGNAFTQAAITATNTQNANTQQAIARVANYTQMLDNFYKQAQKNGFTTPQAYASTPAGQAQYIALEQQRLDLTKSGIFDFFKNNKKAAEELAAQFTNYDNLSPATKNALSLMAGYDPANIAPPENQQPKDSAASDDATKEQKGAPASQNTQGGTQATAGDFHTRTPDRYKGPVQNDLSSVNQNQRGVSIPGGDWQSRFPAAAKPQPTSEQKASVEQLQAFDSDMRMLKKMLSAPQGEQIYQRLLKNVGPDTPRGQQLQQAYNRVKGGPHTQAPNQDMRPQIDANIKAKPTQRTTSPAKGRTAAPTAESAAPTQAKWQDNLRTRLLQASGTTSEAKPPLAAAMNVSLEAQAEAVANGITKPFATQQFAMKRDKAISASQTLQTMDVAAEPLAAQAEAKKIGNYFQYLNALPKADRTAIAKKAEDFVNSKNSALLEAYGIHDVATRKAAIEAIISQENITMALNDIKAQADDQKVSADAAAAFSHIAASYSAALAADASIINGKKYNGNSILYYDENPQARSRLNAYVQLFNKLGVDLKPFTTKKIPWLWVGTRPALTEDVDSTTSVPSLSPEQQAEYDAIRKSLNLGGTP